MTKLRLGETPAIPGSQSVLQQIVWNLLLCAHSRVGAPTRRDITLGCRGEFGTLVLELRDDAPTPDGGESERDLRLHVCQELVRESGGQFSLERGPAGALAVTIELRELAYRNELELPAVGPCAGALQILVVDDNGFLRRSLVHLLEPHNVQTAASAREAASALAARAYDLVLSDVCMPGHTGVELWESTSWLSPKRFVFMTGGVVDGGTLARLVCTRCPVIHKSELNQRVRRVVSWLLEQPRVRAA